VRQASTGKWLAAEPSGFLFKETGSEVDDSGTRADGEPISVEDRVFSRPTSVESAKALPKAPTKSAIFVGHGKNKLPLQQLEKFLSEYKIPHKVAIDEANKGARHRSEDGQKWSCRRVFLRLI
jgi:hypothetical protein